MRNGVGQIASVLLIALAGCGGGGSDAPGALTGLYEGGEGPRRNQLCMIESDGRTAFGFAIWGSADANCSASGMVRRDGEGLSLLPDDDESCALAVTMEGGRIALPNEIAEDCTLYYCGRGASMAGAAFDKVGDEETDALRAVDLVGDPLCRSIDVDVNVK